MAVHAEERLQGRHRSIPAGLKETDRNDRIGDDAAALRKEILNLSVRRGLDVRDRRKNQHLELLVGNLDEPVFHDGIGQDVLVHVIEIEMQP